MKPSGIILEKKLRHQLLFQGSHVKRKGKPFTNSTIFILIIHLKELYAWKVIETKKASLWSLCENVHVFSRISIFLFQFWIFGRVNTYYYILNFLGNTHRNDNVPPLLPEKLRNILDWAINRFFVQIWT